MIHLIDPGCVAPTGHHPAINAAFRQECERSGIPVKLYIHQNADERVKAMFPGAAVLESFFPYSRPQSTDVRHEQSHVVELFRRDLGRITTSGEDRIVVHTVSAGQLSALTEWMPSQNAPASVVLRFPPDHYATARQAADMTLLWGEAIGAAPCRLLADNAPLALYYSQFGGPVEVCPVPVDWSHYRTATPTGDITVGFLGEVREEKGGHYLVDIMRHVHSKRGGIRFNVQTDFKSSETYYDLLAGCDIALCAYHPRAYGMRTSQTVVEAAGFGKPTVTVRGQWVPEGLTGEQSPEFSPRQIALAILRLADRLDECRAAAEATAAAVRGHHNIQSFVRTILQ